MKILICHNRYRQRSGEDIAFDFACELLAQAGHDVVTFTRENSELDNSTFLDLAVKAVQVPYSLHSRRDVLEFARKEKPDVAIVQNVFPLLSPSIYYGLADAGLPVIQFVFNYRMTCANGQLYTHGEICERCIGGSHANGVLRRCYRQSFALSALYSGTLAIHRHLNTWAKCIDLFLLPDLFKKSKLIEAGLPESKMRLICNPFRVEDYNPSFKASNFALFAGRLIRPKGIYTLLDAALQLPEGFRVVVVGGGEEWAGVQAHSAVTHGKASLVGEVYGDGLRDLLSACHFLTLPSEWYDCLPMIVCQAFASGKPVVASAINGIPEFVQHEVNGLTFRPGDAIALGKAMTRLFCDLDLHDTLSKNARQTADAMFHSRHWLEKMEVILGEAVDKKRGSVTKAGEGAIEGKGKR